MLGLSGATFAVGIPFISAWFPPKRRGLALGIFGVGNIGTAIAAFAAPRIAAGWGRSVAFLVVAAALALVGLAFLTVGRDAPGRVWATEPFVARFRAAIALRPARELAALYAITFGGFVAFGVYPPCTCGSPTNCRPLSPPRGRRGSSSWLWPGQRAGGWPIASTG